MSQQQGGLRVDVDEDFFTRGAIGTVTLDKFRDTADMINLLCFILVFLIFLPLLTVVRELWQVVNARYSGSPRSVTTGFTLATHQSPPPQIPFIIWTYWHSPELPPLVTRCIDNWRRESPRHEVRLLHAGNFHHPTPEQREGRKVISLYHDKRAA